MSCQYAFDKTSILLVYHDGMRGGDVLVPLPAGEGSGEEAVPRPQKILIFFIWKWRVLVYSVALNLTFWLQQKAVKKSHI